MRVMLLFVILISFGCGIVQAAENPLSISVPVFTKHFPNSSPDLNEHNYGFGLEKTYSKNIALMIGMFNNSLRKDTYYAGVAYTPFRVLGLHTGVVLGLDLSGGYNEFNPFKPVIGALHFTTGNEVPLGFNIDILPGGGWNNNGDVYGAAAVSMKYSF